MPPDLETKDAAERACWYRGHRTLVAALVPVMLWAGIRTMTAGPVDAPSTDSPVDGLRIDPNTAPWWELCVLPEVGEITAKKIVAFREQNADGRHPVFLSVVDLDHVPGIGPKTIAVIAPYLQFPQSHEP